MNYDQKITDYLAWEKLETRTNDQKQTKLLEIWAELPDDAVEAKMAIAMSLHLVNPEQFAKPQFEDD